MLFSGSKAHAGAAYNISNRRLHISDLDVQSTVNSKRTYKSVVAVEQPSDAYSVDCIQDVKVVNSKLQFYVNLGSPPENNETIT